MILPFENDGMLTSVDPVFIDRLMQIYAAMDRAYQGAADHYGFACDGCRDNCCRTRFYHHTIIEYACMIDGLITADPEKQDRVKSRAQKVVAETNRADKRAAGVRLMCPLNFDERCSLYPYRPMICRLHGIPHELQKAGQKPVYGPGCETFDRRCGRRDYFRFDRTPFYQDLAVLEQEVRQALGFGGKIRMTIAEMIISYAEGMGHGARGEGGC